MQVVNTGRKPWSRWMIGIGGLALLALIAAGGYGVIIWQHHNRQALVAERGATVMPFDLARTTHVFQATPDGGLQQVVALDLSDAPQIALIRMHLHEEATKFQQGDVGDPASIHGAMMPGLMELHHGYAQIAVLYSELPNGAQIRYTTSDLTLVSALHTWFQAQLSDHGDHAMDHSQHP